jgi:hypothetical protein
MRYRLRLPRKQTPTVFAVGIALLGSSQDSPELQGPL